MVEADDRQRTKHRRDVPPLAPCAMLRRMDTANNPGAIPGATPTPEEDRWLTAIEVATLIGKSERTARTWVAEHNIPARVGRPERWSERVIKAQLQNPRGNIGATPETAPGQLRKLDELIEAAYRVTPAEIEQAVSRTSAQYMGDLRAMLVEVGKVYEGQLVAKDQTIATQADMLTLQAETIAELRRRAEAAEAEVLRRRKEQEAAQAAQAGPGAPGAPAAAQEGGGGVWGRLRRLVGR